MKNLNIEYNIVLADADVLKNQLSTAEKTISTYAEKVLLAVAVKYGKDSAEYGRVGGVRVSERKRAIRQSAGSEKVPLSTFSGASKEGT